MVSIIMPAYNTEKYISESIESVLAQTYINWELIIIDDGSTDDTGNIAKSFAAQDPRIKYIIQENLKQGKARNNGISQSKGKWIAFIDSDDLWVPEKIEKQIDFLNNNQVDLVFSAGYVFSDTFENTRDVYHTANGKFKGDEAVLKLLNQNFIPILSVLTTKTAILEAGGFNESSEIQNVEDYHLWLTMLLKGLSFYGLPDKLFYYRKHDLQVTANDPYASEKVLRMLDSHLKIPDRLAPALNKARLLWGRNWYNYNATNIKSALQILSKLELFAHFKGITYFTRVTLMIFGVSISKEIMNKLIQYST